MADFIADNLTDGARCGDAELNRHSSDRAKMAAIDPTGFDEAWGILERLWQHTVGPTRDPGRAVSVAPARPAP